MKKIIDSTKQSLSQLKKVKIGRDQLGKPTPKVVILLMRFLTAINSTLIGSGLVTGMTTLSWLGLGSGIIAEVLRDYFGER